MKREVEEEVSTEVAVQRLIGAYSVPSRDDLVLFFETEIVAMREWHANEEISEMGFFGSDELPSPMSPRTVTRIRDAFQGVTGVVRVFNED